MSTSPQLYTSLSISLASRWALSSNYTLAGTHDTYTHVVGDDPGGASWIAHYFFRVSQATSSGLNLCVCCSQTHAQELPPFLQRLAPMCDLHVAWLVLPRELPAPCYKHDPMQ